MKDCVLYVMTANKSNNDIELQKQCFINWVNKYGYHIKRFFCDNGYNGLNFNRPKFRNTINSVYV